MRDVGVRARRSSTTASFDTCGASRQPLVDREDDAGHLARAVVLGQRRARRAPRRSRRSTSARRRRPRTGRRVLEVDVDVDRGRARSTWMAECLVSRVSRPSRRRRSAQRRRRVPYSSSTSARAVLQHGLLVDRALVGDLAARRSTAARRAAARATTRVELPVLRRANAVERRPRTGSTDRAWSSTSRDRAHPRATPARRRHAARFGKISTPHVVAIVPGDRRRPGRGRRSARGARARSGPTLTHVPVESLKSSAMRPSNMNPRDGIGRIDEARCASPSR